MKDKEKNKKTYGQSYKASTMVNYDSRLATGMANFKTLFRNKIVFLVITCYVTLFLKKVVVLQ